MLLSIYLSIRGLVYDPDSGGKDKSQQERMVREGHSEDPSRVGRLVRTVSEGASEAVHRDASRRRLGASRVNLGRLEVFYLALTPRLAAGKERGLSVSRRAGRRRRSHTPLRAPW